MSQTTEPDNATAPQARSPTGSPAGDHFSETQIRMLRAAVIGMGIILVLGVLALIGRIAYLAKSGGASASNPSQASSPTQAMPVKLAADVRVALPAGAVVKSTSVTADRLTVSFADAAGDGLVIVDLTTGQILSRVRFERVP
jgi:hypothetical protein